VKRVLIRTAHMALRIPSVLLTTLSEVEFCKVWLSLG
jgi:hypothetical protein